MFNILKNLVKYFLKIIKKRQNNKIDQDILEIIKLNNKKINLSNTYVLDNYSFTSKVTKKNNGYEVHIQNLMSEILPSLTQDGSSVIDIGANIGLHTTLMSKFISDTSTVFSFEPVKYNVKKLQLNALINGKNNIKIYEMAVSKDNTINIFNEVDEKDYENGMSRFNDNELIENNVTFKKKEVKSITMDSFFSSRSDKISFIKIDTEGHENNILEGMSQLIKNYNPVMIIECHTDRMKNNKSYDKYLTEYNSYEILKEKDGLFFLKEFDFRRYVRGDILCVPKNFKIDSNILNV